MLFLDEEEHTGTKKEKEVDVEQEKEANKIYEEINEERLRIKAMRGEDAK